ncbi:hypothetical protein GCM10022239_09640 [Leifsonia bigeumensis]|uniref:Glycosyltransferase family 2 protein n=1 Tax=Leifsonella bigeumensis TaxID=433643 RepID=A0ABP7FBJ2_9MICO
MQPRVTTVLVARAGAGYLGRTLAALAAQTRKPDVTIAVDASSNDGSDALLAASGPAQVLSVRDGTTFGSAVNHAVQFAPVAESDDEWLWLLGHDNAPHPDALAQLLGAVERAPSVAVAGPKLMRHDRADMIAAFGETMSTFGTSVALVDDELDQAQHDTRDDVLGVAAAGMLVRRSLWKRLGGFDPGLPSIDASLDFSVRARLAGHRVVTVPGARVASAGGPEAFGREKVSARRRFRVARAAQLHRRLVYSPAWAVALHWLSLVPLAVLRSIGDLVGKRPGAIGGEFRAAFGTAFAGRIGAARRNLRRTRTLGWAAIAPLRMSTGELRERRGQAREAELAEPDADTPVSAGRTGVYASAQAGGRAGFVAHGGFWVVLLVGIVGVLAYGALLGAAAVSGGGLRPLTETVPELWANIGYGWRELGTGTLGAADPFAVVLAVLGSITFWSPSYSVVLVYLLALPLSALGAWFAARRISRSPWLPLLAALLWSLAPPLLAALAVGRLGAVLTHLLLPWLFTAALGAARSGASRSWASGAAAALLFAVVAAGTPSLLPALLVLFVVLLVVRPGSAHRTIGIPIPALVLFGPLVVQQVLAGNPLGILADPGVVLGTGSAGGGTASGWRLALADPTGALHGWSSILAELSAAGTPLPGAGAALAPALVAILLAPLGVLALLALFLPGARRAIPAMVIALLGYLSAVGAAHLQVGAVGDVAATVWPGSGLSLYWLGLIVAAIVGLGALGRMATPVSVLAGLTVTALAIPLLGAMLIGTAAVHPATTRILPALVTAEARTHPGAGTLVITSLGEAGIAVRLERGLGASLDDQSTLVSTRPRASDLDDRLATLAGNLAAPSGYDAASDLEELDIPFVLVSPASEDDTTYRSMVDALNGNEILSPVGTTANGLLWRYAGEADADGVPGAAGHPGAVQPGNGDTALGSGYLVALGVVFGITVLLAIPTGRRRIPHRTPAVEDPADTFDEEDHD